MCILHSAQCYNITLKINISILKLCCKMQKVKVLLHHLNNLSCHSELTRELQMSHLAQSLFSLALLSITVLMLWEASHISEQH